MISRSKSLKARFLRSTVGVLLLAFLIMAIFVFGGLKNISSNFSHLGAKQTESFKKDLLDFSETSKKRTKLLYLAESKRRFSNLIKKDSFSLLAVYQDNSFSQMRSFLTKTFKEDKNLLQAIFFVLQDGEIKAWQYLNRDYPDGLDLPVVYNPNIKSWVGTYKGEVIPPIYDPSILNTIGSRKGSGDSTLEKVFSDSEEIEFSQAILKDKKNLPSEDRVRSALSKKEEVGFLRYVLSLEGMRKSIYEEEVQLQIYLSKLEQDSKNTQWDTENKVLSLIHQITFFFIGLMILLSLLCYLLVGYMSQKIVEPIGKLIEVSDKISLGNYDISIDTQGQDEVGALAKSFENMRKGILKRDSELEQLNKSLEQKVAVRTEQLKLENSKVEYLLNNMRQAVFVVLPDMTIASPVSSYTKIIFLDDIEGKNVIDVLFEIEDKSKNKSDMLTGLSVVFGEDDLQWLLMEDVFPAELKFFKKSSEKSLRIAYNPIYDENASLEKIMFVIDDVTKMESIEAQVELAKQEADFRMGILSELSFSDISDLQEVLNEAYFVCEKFISFQFFGEDKNQKGDILGQLHTLKGNSRLLGLNQLSEIVHRAESYLVDSSSFDPADASAKLIDFNLEWIQKIDIYSKYVQEYFRIDNSYERLRMDQFQKVIGSKEVTELGILEDFSASVMILAAATERLQIYHLIKNKDELAVLKILLEIVYRYQVIGLKLKPIQRDYKALMKLYHDFQFGEVVSIVLKRGFFEEQDAPGDLIALLEICFLIELNLEGNIDLVLVALIEEDWSSLKDSNLGRGILSLSEEERSRVSRPLLAKVLSKSHWLDVKDCVENLFVELIGSGFDEIHRRYSLLLREVDPLSVGLINLLEGKNLLGSFRAVILISRCIFSFSNDRRLSFQFEAKKMLVYKKQIDEILDFVQASSMEQEDKNQILSRVSSLSFLSLKHSLNKFYSGTREIALGLGKEIHLRILGDEIYLPRLGIKFVGDFLNHLLRNSIDHGIESKESRLAKGKSIHGNLFIEIEDLGEDFRISVGDDGQGISLYDLKQIAVEKSIYSKEEISSLEAEEVLQIIFEPQFSTKKQLGEISGRGVGLSYVKQQLQSLGGSIRVESYDSKGTVFRMDIPKNLEFDEEVEYNAA